VARWIPPVPPGSEARMRSLGVRCMEAGTLPEEISGGGHTDRESQLVLPRQQLWAQRMLADAFDLAQGSSISEPISASSPWHSRNASHQMGR
jgi:hypothetical protein